MNSDDIESLLERMPLVKVPASLDARVLGRARRGHRMLLWTAAAAGLAAAAVVVAVLNFGGPTKLPPLPPPSEEAMAAAEPVRLEQNWSQLSYEGVVVPDGRTPLRQFRRQTLEHVQWIDASNGTRTEMTIPREEVILIKAPVD
jgi:hypothetical protein